MIEFDMSTSVTWLPPRTGGELGVACLMSEEAGSSPYATGGGGTVLEHLYGTIALGALLLGDPR